MPSITVKNIPDKIYTRIKESAKANRRSVNSEIIHQLEQSMFANKVDEEEIRYQVQQFRSKIKQRLSTEEIEAAINRDRDDSFGH